MGSRVSVGIRHVSSVHLKPERFVRKRNRLICPGEGEGRVETREGEIDRLGG